MINNKEYVIYQFNRVMGSKEHLALTEAELNGLDSNRFETEEDAIKYLEDNKMLYEHYTILPIIYITD